MKDIEMNIEELVTNESKKIKKRRPLLEEVEVSLHKNGRGSFLSRLRAKAGRGTIVVSQESRCPEVSVRRVFSNLNKLLRKKKPKRVSRYSYNLKEAA